MPIQFGILGPLAASVDGVALRLGSPKQRALLGLLLLHAGETVPRARLIDELWGDSPPPTIDSELNVYLSRVRRLLAAAGAEGALLRDAYGYRLEVPEGALDADRFAALAAAGAATDDAETAAATLREALALWRGPAFADLQQPFAVLAGARLEELRLSVLEQRIDADLALGRDGALVAELRELVDQHPFRERFRAQLMLALDRAGLRVDALRVYQELRQDLSAEFGIEPGAELKELERSILHGEPLRSLHARGGHGASWPERREDDVREGTAPAAPAEDSLQRRAGSRSPTAAC